MIHTQFSVAEWLLNLFRKHLTAAAREEYHSGHKSFYWAHTLSRRTNFSLSSRGAYIEKLILPTLFRIGTISDSHLYMYHL